MSRDLTCLAENMVFPADPEKTGLNLNEIIIGSPGQIAKMKVFSCNLEYIREIFSCFEETMSKTDEKTKNDVFRILLLTPEDCNKSQNDSTIIKRSRRYKKDAQEGAILSQEEILRLMLMIDDNNDEG